MDTRALLRDAGLSCTGARIAVVDILMEATAPVKQLQIAESLGDRFDRVTIYRTLDRLVKADLVHKVFVEERACHYELAHHCSKTQCHPHFTCIQCGSTHCLTGLKIPMAESPYRGYRIQRQQVRLEGVCPACIEQG